MNESPGRKSSKKLANLEGVNNAHFKKPSAMDISLQNDNNIKRPSAFDVSVQNFSVDERSVRVKKIKAVNNVDNSDDNIRKVLD